jgi:hypothetical protein
LPQTFLRRLDKPRETWAAPLWITCEDLCYEVVMKPPKNLPQMSVVCDRVLVRQKKGNKMFLEVIAIMLIVGLVAKAIISLWNGAY